MTTSRIPAVLDALISTFTAAVPSAVVYDGQPVTVPATTDSFITVGWSPDDGGPTGQQSWSDMGNRTRDEQIDVPCYVDAYSGDTDTASRRTAAFTILASIQTALETDPSLGGAVPPPYWAEISGYSVRQEQTESGLEVGITFHIVITVLMA